MPQGLTPMARRVYNFSPGPGMLPDEVLVQIRDELVDCHGTGMPVLEMSHRGKAFGSIIEQTRDDRRARPALPRPGHRSESPWTILIFSMATLNTPNAIGAYVAARACPIACVAEMMSTQPSVTTARA